jgi:hypothetical protein
MPLNEKINTMRTLVYIPLCLLLCLAGCGSPASETEKELSSEELALRDSLSKLAQHRRADSLKAKNPLLFLPPDSTYSGEYTDRYASGIIKFKGFYRVGKLHGHWMSFYPNGLMWSELHYDKGLRHGPNITYFENGKKRYEGFYKNDQRDSVWVYYDSTGKVSQKVLFRNDLMVEKLPLNYVRK